MRQQLGPECFSRPYDSFTGYLGELYGISLATKMFQVVIICVDSQAGIRAVGLPKKKGWRQHIMQRIVQAIERLRQRGSTVEIHWVPAYIGLRGNQVADKSAKEATGRRVKKAKA